MNRRAFFAATVGAVAAAHGTAGAQAGDDTEAVKQRLIDWYRAFANPRVDRAHYLSFTTDDYLLCENGELLDKAGDLALLDSLPADLVRTDRFDFRRVTVEGDRADLVYFLEAEMNDSTNGARSRRWLESAGMRRAGGEWRCSLLHSTRISPPPARGSPCCQSVS